MDTSSILLVGLLIFVLVYGISVHRSLSAEMRSRGETPPTLLAFLLAPYKRHSLSLPRPIRVVLGVAFILGSAGLILLAGSLALKVVTSGVRHPMFAVALVLVISVIALAIAYVGVRLIRMKRATDSLLRPDTNGAV